MMDQCGGDKVTTWRHCSAIMSVLTAKRVFPKVAYEGAKRRNIS